MLTRRWNRRLGTALVTLAIVIAGARPAQAGEKSPTSSSSWATTDRTALGWGSNPDKDATYLNVTPPKNDGVTIYKLDVKDVPVGAFWSVSVYNAAGYYEEHPYDAYTVNDITGKKNGNGSITIQFGGCDGTIPNCLPTVKGWNYTVRLYRPRAAILNGTWNFPDPQPVG